MISAKVGNGTAVGTAVGLVTWALTTFIPAWHTGIPVQLANVLPLVIGVIGYFVGGYLSTHQATVTEVETAISNANKVIAVTEPGAHVGAN
jgi:hypothetical protein